MTATPIPRTLALTVYGDLAVSEIAKPPASRKPIVTSWIEERRAPEAYRRLTRLLERGPPGLRRLPADRGVGDLAGPRRGGGGRAAAARRAPRVPRRLPAREAEAGRPARADGALQGARARRARRDDGDRGRRRRPERDRDDRPGGRPVRPRAAPPAARPCRARGGAVVLPAGLAAEGGADGSRGAAGWRRWSRRPTASSSPRSTWSSAARASCSARASRASPICASRSCAPTARCSSGRGRRRRS